MSNRGDLRKQLEGTFEVPPPPKLLVADIQISEKGETTVEVYQQLAVFKHRAYSLGDAVRFVAVKSAEFGLPSITIVQPIGVDQHAIDMLRLHGLRVNGR